MNPNTVDPEASTLTLYQVEHREFLIENLPVRIHFIIEMIWWTGLAPWEFEFSSPGSLISTIPVQAEHAEKVE